MSRRHAGVGISLRQPHYDAILASDRRVDWLEIQPENFMGTGGRPARALEQCLERWTVVPHGVALSIGGPDPLAEEYLAPLEKLLARVDPPYFSEHICYSSAHGVQFHDLLPLPFTDEAVHHVAKRARQVVDRLERPIVLENISFYAVMPGSTMTQGQFITSLLDEIDGGLLLDVNNVYVNATNHGRDVHEVLDELPLERTRQIHLAGHRKEGDLLIDDHGSAVIDEVWALYRHVLERIGPVPTLIEWENSLPPLDAVLDEADVARAIYDEVARMRS